MTRIEERRSRLWLPIAAVALFALVAASAIAFGGGHHGGPHGLRGEFHEFMLNRMLDHAEATDEQREKILAIMESAREDVKALRKDSPGEFHERALEILSAETVDRAAIDALRAEHQGRIEAAMDRMSEAIVEAAAVLSQEQRVAIADEMRERFAEHGGRHFGRRG